MDMPGTLPAFYAGPFAFCHEPERFFAGNGVIERHEVCEACSLALGVYVIDPVKFHI
jgi:hypothetical protein